MTGKEISEYITFPKTFEKGLDNRLPFEYNIHVAMREWRNWQTRTFEGRVVYTVRVQVPFLAPKIIGWVFPSDYFFC